MFSFIRTVLAHAGMTFMQGDLLDSDLSNVSVLMLANQCWDKHLIRKATAKLGSELQTGAVVVEYTESLKRYTTGRLELLTVVRVKVSWNEQQPMHVWRAV